MHNKSETIAKISAALLRAQKKIGAATKGTANSFFKSKYADLGAVMEACKDAFNEEGITVLQPIVSTSEGDFVETTLLHESGEFISSSMKLLPAKNMQEYGSCISYGRRYSLQSIAFITAADDDAELAMGRGKPSPTAYTPPKAPVKASPPSAGGFKPKSVADVSAGLVDDGRMAITGVAQASKPSDGGWK